MTPIYEQGHVFDTNKTPALALELSFYETRPRHRFGDFLVPPLKPHQVAITPSRQHRKAANTNTMHLFRTMVIVRAFIAVGGVHEQRNSH